MRRTSFAAVVFVVLSLAGRAWAADEALEHVVVRNRLFSVAGHPEVAASIGTTLSDRLTFHWAFNASVAINLMESLALEARGSWSLTGHTSLADRVSQNFLLRDPNTVYGIKTADDLSDLWELRGSLMGGIRWQPVYGKVSVFSELPLHFQAYLWAGAGVGELHRESVVYCMNVIYTDTGERTGACRDWLSQNRFGPVFSGAVGARLFMTQKHGITLELRDISFIDEYRVNIDRQAAEAGDPNSGTNAKNAGLTNLIYLNVGYTFLF